MFEFNGGDFAGKILKHMPQGSSCVISGSLTTDPFIIDNVDILFNNKHIGGLFLPGWLLAMTEAERKATLKIVADDLDAGGALFATEIFKILPFEEYEKAITERGLVASQGKYVLKLW